MDEQNTNHFNKWQSELPCKLRYFHGRHPFRWRARYARIPTENSRRVCLARFPPAGREDVPRKRRERWLWHEKNPPRASFAIKMEGSNPSAMVQPREDE